MTIPILCFGEALIDFLNTGKQKNGELSLNQFTQFPGGAPANAAVAIAKLGGAARFAGQIGSDTFGEFLVQALEQYGVDTRHTCHHTTAPTALAFVFLDEQGERSFLFHRDNSADMVMEPSQIEDNWFAEQPILHFCSNTLTHPGITETTRTVLQRARTRNCLISFDVNLRHNLWPPGSADRDLINQFVMQSQLVKFSVDELQYLSNGDNDVYLRRCIENGVRAIVVTDGGNPINLYAEGVHRVIQAPNTNVVDTTGGGDAFIGAVLFGLSRSDRSAIEKIDHLSALVAFASHCGSIAVSRPGAFPAFPSFDEVEAFYRGLH
ncbi:carbohydrate kinase family protein [Microbulbifer sp. ARAS458-1]|uniref:carbohydrate kinase family protein n=1 Tax=Microbulbifer sp. ARAS458-1 TaxID=3140242 RepID=UPI0038781C29